MGTEERRRDDATAVAAPARDRSTGNDADVAGSTQERESPLATSDATRPPVDLLVPSLLAGLATDDPHTTETAGCAVVVLTRACPEAVGHIADSLVASLRSDESRQPIARTLATLARGNAGTVREAIVADSDRQTARRLVALVRDADPWEIPQGTSADGTATEYATAFRQVVEVADRSLAAPDEAAPGSEPADHVTSDEAVAADDGTGPDRETSPEGEPTPETDSRSGRLAHSSGPDRTRRERIEQIADSATFRAIARRSVFDDLTVVAPETERRYGDVVRVRARADDTERGVAVRLLDVPHDRASVDGICEPLREWTRFVDVPGVVTAVDWGQQPRPWVVTEYVEETLATRGSIAPARALQQARRLTGALVALHQRSVVHGGIDPRTVVYSADSLDGGRPMLDNVGLLSVYRRHVDPSDYLDPRYAAPEYYDSQYGRLDHATDIYQLGMVLYRLFAGGHPFEGSYAEVRACVLEDHPPAPSEVTPALPATIDEVVAKATAKQKLTRYETATGLHQDLSRICESVLE